MGGTLDNIQPGLEALKKHPEGRDRDRRSSPEIQQNFAQNDAWLAPYAQDYAFTLRKAGLPVEVRAAEGRRGGLADHRQRSSPAARTAISRMKFIDFSLRAEAQAVWAKDAALLAGQPQGPKLDRRKPPPTCVYGEEAVKKLVDLRSDQDRREAAGLDRAVEPADRASDATDVTRAWPRA